MPFDCGSIPFEPERRGRRTDARTATTWLGDLITSLELRLTIIRERRQLLALDDRMLKDIGISRADAEREASRPIEEVLRRRM